MSARELLIDRFSSLSPKLQAAARYVVDHPNDVVIGSMRMLAEKAALQPATLVRLAQHLGYAGWPELKDAFAQDLGLKADGFGKRARGLVARSRDSTLIGDLFEAHRRNLATTETQSATPLRSAARLLEKAAMVHVAGFRASFPIACALVYDYRLFRHSVQLIDGQGGGIEMQLRPIGEHDAVVVIGFAPYSRESMAVIEAARAVGAPVVVFTDSAASPLALGADATVLFAVASPSFFPSIAAAMAAVEALLGVLVAGAGDAAAQEIGRAESQLFDAGAYVEPAPPKAESKRKSKLNPKPESKGRSAR